MKPYFEQGGVVIYHGRADDVLPTLAPSSVDLIVTDPPYGVDWQSSHRTRTDQFSKIEGDDGSLDVPAAMASALRALRRGRHVYIFGKFDLSDLPLTESVELIWDKENVGLGDLSLPWGPSHETITFATYEISKANRGKGYGRLAARLRQGSVIRCPRLRSGQVASHPTEKPVLLLRQLIESSSLIGETVLDPFMGSGSTLEAALIEGRSAIGIEISERYCEIAARRLDQMTLFGTAS
jgi:DNA modification methylase